jgi:RimJ/RimL family protein N-acetyltransferase
VSKGYSWGVYDEHNLVSVTDAPGIPYMSDLIVEPGINTLARRKGYAKMACAALIKKLVKDGKVPIWSCGSRNIASAHLAETLGYKKLADVITVIAR